jgi:hypothetical protein
VEPQYFRPGVDDLSAYREAMRRAEEGETAVVVDEQGRTPEGLTPEELEAAAAAVVVPVAASDQPLQPEEQSGTETTAVVEDTPVVEAPVVAEETPEQLQARVAQLEAQLAEKEQMIGRQSGEVGQLRQDMQQLREEITAARTTPTVPASAPVVITQDMIEDDPARATAIAYQQNDVAALERAFDYWKEVDPFTAGAWRSDTLASQREAALEARVQAEIAKTRQEQEARANVNVTWNTAMQSVAAKHPDFLQVDETTGRSNAERLLTEVAPQYPHLIAVLRDGDATAKAEVLDALYVLDHANRTNPEQVKAQLEEAAAQAAAEEAAARAAAATVVGQPTAGQDPVPQTYEERERAAYAARFEGKASLDRGWTGRSS